MSLTFEQVVKQACQGLLSEQEAGAAPVQQVQAPAGAPAPANAPATQDAAAPQPQGAQTNPQAGYDVYKDLISKLLHSLQMFASAITSGDDEQLLAIKKLIPDNLTDQINQTSSQLTTAEPAAVAQAVTQLLTHINPSPTGA